MAYRLVPRHADAIVGDGDGARGLVDADTDLETRILGQQLRLRQGLEAELVGGIRGIGYQLAEENLLLAVQRMDHQLQQLFSLGLETESLLLGICGGHGPRLSIGEHRALIGWGTAHDFKRRADASSAESFCIHPALKSRRLSGRLQACSTTPGLQEQQEPEGIG